MGINTNQIPGFDPDREPYVKDISYPTITLDGEVSRSKAIMGDANYAYFKKLGVSKEVVKMMNIGFNGRYLIYPYYLANGKCYAAHCLLHGDRGDEFWEGNDKFSAEGFRIYNEEEIIRCEDGALFITDSEDQLLIIQELGYPAIAVPAPADMALINIEQLAYVKQIFIVVKNAPESKLAARTLATKLGFKVRIIKWSTHENRDYSLCQLAKDNIDSFDEIVPLLIKSSTVFSPFSSPIKEYNRFIEVLENDIGQEFQGLKTGLEKLDLAHNGISGINIIGGQPKAGKSTLIMQLSTEIARRKTPVIYYDFENGWQKIYTRTLCRLSRLSAKEILMTDLDEEKTDRLNKAKNELKDILEYFRVVTDRAVTPDIMRKHIDFLKHETRKDEVLIVIDSLHKLPFKDVSEQRTGIDLWLRQMESIRDGYNASFLVISELSRGAGGGGYGEKPDMSSFKASGDIEYSADNAMIFVPDWNVLDPVSIEKRSSTLWMVASRENTPGKIAAYALQFPFWGFEEK